MKEGRDEVTGSAARRKDALETQKSAPYSGKKFLADHGLRHIRYQDLRHSCASLLIAAHVPLIQVQHWLGHSTMLTTANMYAHLDTSLVDECGKDIKKI